MWRCLVIEDDLENARYIADGLRAQGHVAVIAAEPGEALRRATAEDWDVVVLDRMLGPRVDGLNILQTMRGLGLRTPVLVLSALSALDERVRGLKAGGDDYLGKPFAFSELLARIQALLRRGKLHEVSNYALKDLHLDVVARRASRNGQRLDLTAKEFALLTLLMRRQGNVLSRTQLAEQVWDINFDSDTNIVEVAIRRLRSKIDDPFEEKLLHTVRGMGYVLESRQGGIP